MLLTSQFLEDRNACLNGIKFFKRNFPNGLDLSKYKIKSEVDGVPHSIWSNWLKFELLKQFDSKNRLVCEYCSNGEIFTYEYDLNGNLISEQSNLSENIIYKYDDCNRLIEKHEVLYNFHKYWQYNKNGECIKDYDSKGNYITYEYDLNGKLSKETSSAGFIIQYIYNTNSFKKIIKSNENSKCSQMIYNYQGQLLEYLLNEKLYKWEYDKNKNLIKEFFPNNEIIEYKYDDSGNHIETIFPDNTTSYKIYNQTNNLIESKERTGDIFKWKYDTRGNIIEEIYSHRKNKHWRYEYNEDHLIKIFKNDKLVCWLEEIL